MSTTLHWVDGPWPGKIALSARPRGGDWLTDELSAWRREGVGVIVSLLKPEEESDLELADEAREARAQGLDFLSVPVEDRGLPDAESNIHTAIERLNSDLSAGKNVVIHCRQGIGRTGLLGASLLISKGIPPEDAVKILSASRGIPVPETPEQRRWIDAYSVRRMATTP